MVYEACGHGDSFRKSLLLTNDWNPCPPLLSKVRSIRMNQKDDVYPAAGKVCFEKPMLAIAATS
jgi:hypothetical protein